jgi:hypothetical protein
MPVKIRLLGLLLSPAVLASPLGAQAKERVYLLADSLEWVLSLRVDPVTDAGTCEVATRAQPGARLARFSNGMVFFSVNLQGDPLELMPAMLDTLSLRVDEAPPMVRRAARDEIVHNLVLLKDDAANVLRGAKRLRIRATYRIGEKSGAGGFQDLDIDLAGLSALSSRVLSPRCR